MFSPPVTAAFAGAAMAAEPRSAAVKGAHRPRRRWRYRESMEIL